MFSAFHPSASVDDGVKPGTEDARRIVIVGGGIAGLTGAEYARRTSNTAQITLIVHPDEGLPYYRLNLTRLVAGEMVEANLPLKDPEFYTAQRIEVRAATAASVDNEAKQLHLADGNVLAYDRLVLATGAVPFVPPWPGSNLPGVCALRTRADAQALIAKLPAGRRCICIGGGLLGLEAAFGLARRGVYVTVLEAAPTLLARQLVAPAGKLLEQHLGGLGLQCRCGVAVQHIDGPTTATGVTLATGETLKADVVLVAAGIRPDLRLAKTAELHCNKGLVVDDRGVTSDTDILAAGDCTEHRGNLYGLWSAAYAQGLVAGCNAAGGNESLQTLTPSSRLKVVDLSVLSIGEFAATPSPQDVVERALGPSYIRLVRRDGRLVGANLVGDTGLDLAVTSAMDTAQPLTNFADLSALFAPTQI